MLFLVAVLVVSGTLIRWMLENSRHQRSLSGIPVRIHVNGIRGKSTVVRMIAGAFREAGLETVAKTTGNATRVINAEGDDVPVTRPGAATILEQLRIVREHTRATTQALVMECMALRPEYQFVSERRMIRSTTGVILNVRPDHEEELGSSLTEIAESLCNTIPPGGTVITAESRKEPLCVLEREAAKADAKLIIVDADKLDEQERARLGPFTFPENVAVALEVAQQQGIDRDTALRGVLSVDDDPGASGIFEHTLGNGRFFWVNLFGVNDIRSIDENLGRFIDWLDSKVELYIFLSSRDDRPDRTRQFLDYLSSDSRFAGLVLPDDTAESAVREIDRDQQQTLPRIDFKTGQEEAVEELLQTLRSRSGAKDIALIGMANIHTQSAEVLRSALESDKQKKAGKRSQVA